MPAPVPIEFASDIGPLGELAFAAGQAQGRRRDFERQQQQRSQQEARDLSFLRDEMSRRQRSNEVESQFRLQQSVQADQRTQQSRQTFQLQQAGRQLRLDQRNAQAGERRSQIGGRSRLRQAISAATGPRSQAGERLVNVNPQGGGSIKTNRGTFDFQPDGSVVRKSPEFGRELIDPTTGRLNTSLLPDELRDPANLARDRALTGGTQFVRAGRGSADLVTMSVAQQLQTLSAAQNLPPNDRELLERTIRSGGLDPKQLLDEIQQRTPRANDERKIDGLSIRDRQLEIQQLRLKRLSFNEFNDPEGTQRQEIERLIEAEQENITRQQLIQDAPQLSGRSLANPSPSETGNIITEGVARQFLQQAGGDPEAARRLAIEAGFILPQ